MPKADIAMISPLLLITGLVVKETLRISCPVIFNLSIFLKFYSKLPALTSKSVTSTPLDLVVFAIPLKIITSAGIWMAAQWTIDAYAHGHCN
jgi:hypothetical protein